MASSHEQALPRPEPQTLDTGALRRLAAQATTHCLTGCAIGEVLGMAVGTALAWGNGATIVLAVALAFLFGYTLTMWSLRGAGLAWSAAFSVALAADTISIATMETVDNAVMVVVPGALAAGLQDPLFWGSLAFSLALAWLAAWPVNYWLLRRGKGHACVHDHHQH